MVGLGAATASETDENVRGKIQMAQLATVISWTTYPVVYLFPMLGITASKAVVGIQIGYCASDIISKCGEACLFTRSPLPRPKRKAFFREDAWNDIQELERAVVCMLGSCLLSDEFSNFF